MKVDRVLLTRLRVGFFSFKRFNDIVMHLS